MTYLRDLRPALMLLLVLTLLTGITYPLLVTGISRMVFAHQAGGSIVMQGNTAIGSRLIGQNFHSPGYFWGRPSATTPQPYNGLASGGSNAGPLNPALIDSVIANAKRLRGADPGATGPIPVDLVTASASGLDPDISVAAAAYQVGRVAKARHVSESRIRALIDSLVQRPELGVIGEMRVNVLALNRALDASLVHE